MREIKFRAWDTKKNEMIYDGEIDKSNDSWDGPDSVSVRITFEGTPVAYTQDDGGKNGLWEHSVDIKNRLLLMEFTGLKDKNGKEIYEGDIVYSEANDSMGIVKYGEYICQHSEDANDWHIGFYTENVPGHEVEGFYNEPLIYAVVGNIYENPEMVTP